MFFQRIDFLSNLGIKFKYTKFTQSAMAEGLDDAWGGSCNVLSYQWLYKKICQDNIQEVATYEITEANLPHVVVTGENDPQSEDIQQVTQMMNSFYLAELSGQRDIDGSDDTTKEQAIDNLIKLIESHPYNYGIISAILNIKNVINHSEDTKGHAMAFVKRGDEISFFDSNNGEITFSKFSDFSTWFKEEIQNGALKYMIADSQNIINEKPASPQTSEEDSKNTAVQFSNLTQLLTKKGAHNPATLEVPSEADQVKLNLEKRMSKIRNNKSADNIGNVCSTGKYKINFWHHNQYVNPEKYKGYTNIKCGLIMMSEISKDNILLKKTLIINPVFVIAHNQLYFAYKKRDGAIEFKNVEAQDSNTNALIKHLNLGQIKLKENEKTKILSDKLSPRTLVFIDEKSGLGLKTLIEKDLFQHLNKSYSF